jgi:hypothetical protein
MNQRARHLRKEILDKWGVYNYCSLCGETGRLVDDLADTNCKQCVARYVQLKGQIHDTPADWQTVPSMGDT